MRLCAFLQDSHTADCGDGTRCTRHVEASVAVSVYIVLECRVQEPRVQTLLGEGWLLHALVGASRFVSLTQGQCLGLRSVN